MEHPGLREQLRPNRDRLVEVVSRLASTSDLQPLLDSIEQAASEMLPCTRAQIMQYDALAEEFFGESELRISARVGAEARAAATQRVIRVSERLVVPLIAPEGDLMGVLHVDPPSGHEFSEEEAESALVLGALAAIALKRQRLMDQAAEKERLERELALARELVRPPRTVEIAGFRLAGAFHPAQHVGGDGYDVVRLGSDRLAFLVADASGHGLDSALVASRCRAYFHALAGSCESLSALVVRLNGLLFDDLRCEERFVAVSLGYLESGKLEVMGAGQTCCLWLPSGGAPELVDPTAPPLGAFPEIEPETRTFAIAEGDQAVFFTDGLPDWRNAEGECFGEERLVVAAERWRGDADLSLRLYESARDFARRPQGDDVTCLVIRATPSGP